MGKFVIILSTVSVLPVLVFETCTKCWRSLDPSLAGPCQRLKNVNLLLSIAAWHLARNMVYKIGVIICTIQACCSCIVIYIYSW